jgi:hypothetical protein
LANITVTLAFVSGLEMFFDRHVARAIPAIGASLEHADLHF